MLILIIGLLLFLGLHSLRMIAPAWRTRQIEQRGLKGWKNIYSVLALIGFILIVIGYGAARQQSTLLWTPPLALHYVAALLTLPAFILLAAANVPGNAIKNRLQHPMVLGVKVWAFAHLLVAGTIADIVLFGSFLMWAICDFRSVRQRPDSAGKIVAPTSSGTAITVIAGVVVWALFTFYLHEWLIGVAPISQ